MEIIVKPFQAAFLMSTAPNLAMISAIGTGKTRMGLSKLWNFCMDYPDSLALLVRKQQTDAHGSTLRDFKTYFNKEFDSKNEFHFSNGSTIIAKHAGEVDALKNYNLNFILVEQGEELNQEIFDYLCDRLRRQTSPYRQICVLANAQGENYLKKLFINNAETINTFDEASGQREYLSANGSYHCITANSFALSDVHSPDFIKRLQDKEKTSPNHYRQMYLNDMTALSSDDALFSYSELQGCKNKHPVRPGYGMRLMGVDPARFGDDATGVVIIQQMGVLHWEVVHVDDWRGQNLDATAGRIMSLARQWKVDKGSIDCDGLGSGVFDALVYGQRQSMFSEFHNPNISADKNKDFGNNRTDAAFRLKALVEKGHICITDELLIGELCNALRFKFMTDGRRVLVSKNELRKEGIQSPGRADALIMAVSLIDDVVFEQSRQYVPRQTQYYSDGDWNPFLPEKEIGRRR